MQSGYRYPVASQEALNFTEALAVAGAVTAMNDLNLPPQVRRRSMIRAIAVSSIDNCGWEFNFFGSTAGYTADPATDSFIARWGFAIADGLQLAGAGLWRYYIDGLAIPYVDLDTVNSQAPKTLHVVLSIRGANAKAASGVGVGNIVATFYLEPMSEW